jgi:hypothetical protein
MNLLLTILRDGSRSIPQNTFFLDKDTESARLPTVLVKHGSLWDSWKVDWEN